MVLILFCLFGCATPNIKPFAEQTSQLAGSVALEQKSISVKFGEVVELARDKEKKGLKEKKKKFDSYRNIINSVLKQSVNYSDTLVQLAEAGEKGSEAAESLLNCVNDFSSLVGLGTGIISEGVTSALKELSTAVTKIQAQTSLEKATTEAQPAIDKLADVLIAVYNDEAFEKIVIALKETEIRLIEDDLGLNTIGFYELMKERRDKFYLGLKQRIEMHTPVEGFCVNSKGKSDSNCLAEKDVQIVATLNQLMEQVEPIAIEYQNKKKEIINWRIQRKENSKIIIKAIKEWRDEHKKITTILQKCGGLKFYKCQELNLGNLKAIIDELKGKLSKEG